MRPHRPKLLIHQERERVTMKLNSEALAAYDRGIADGTITDTVAEIIDILEHQEIVSYCSENGTYSFDGGDIITGVTQ
jgi:hypothetical protein